MSDLLAWSIPLGRWRETQYRIHYILLVFAAIRCLEALFSEKHTPVESAAWAVCILAALAVHELAHAVAANGLGVRRGTVCFWPLGEINRPGSTTALTPGANMIVALAGPIASLTLAMIALLSLRILGARVQLDPFGGGSDGAPLALDGTPLLGLSAAWWIGCIGHASWILGLVNLIPAHPFDGGVAARFWQRPTMRETDLSPHIARGAVVVLAVAGVLRFLAHKPGSLSLFALALVIEFFVRWEARQAEESNEIGDEPFGYDFSQGYTSLEASPPAVRPRRESALTRWQRLRAESHRRRQVARRAADEQRLDSLLDKIHREGRASLTREEERFLLRQSRERKSRHGDGA